MTDKTTDRADLLGACAMEEVRHCDPIKVSAEATCEDFGIYFEVSDLIASGIDNAYTTIVTERAAQAEEFGRLFRGTIGGMLASGEYRPETVAFFDRHGIRA